MILPLIRLRNYPAQKSEPPHVSTLLMPSERPHAAYGGSISLNKPAFTLPWLTLEFFLAQRQGPSLGGLSQGLTPDLERDHILTP